MIGIGPRAISCSLVTPQRPQRVTATLGISVLLWREIRRGASGDRHTNLLLTLDAAYESPP